MHFPEGLEDSPFKTSYHSKFKFSVYKKEYLLNQLYVELGPNPARLEQATKRRVLYEIVLL